MSAASDFKNKPWAQQPDETPKAYAAFLTYLELGRDRSIVKALDAAAVLRSNRGHWQRWSAAYQWVKRVKAYDSDHLLERVKGRKEAIEDTRQDAVDVAKRAMGNLIDLMDGKLPPGDKEIVCGRDGKPQMVTIEGAFGVPVKVGMERALVSPQVRLKATELALGLAGIVTAKRIEITGRAGDDLRLELRHRISNLPPDLKAGLHSLFGLAGADDPE